MWGRHEVAKRNLVAFRFATVLVDFLFFNGKVRCFETRTDFETRQRIDGGDAKSDGDAAEAKETNVLVTKRTGGWARDRSRRKTQKRGVRDEDIPDADAPKPVKV